MVRSVQPRGGRGSVFALLVEWKGKGYDSRVLIVSNIRFYGVLHSLAQLAVVNHVLQKLLGRKRTLSPRCRRCLRFLGQLILVLLACLLPSSCRRRVIPSVFARSTRIELLLPTAHFSCVATGRIQSYPGLQCWRSLVRGCAWIASQSCHVEQVQERLQIRGDGEQCGFTRSGHAKGEQLETEPNVPPHSRQYLLHQRYPAVGCGGRGAGVVRRASSGLFRASFHS
mmetsp:Transcript_4871/g.12051  ORF Transcript_4871/g.12051 Transcript_4871/m.12051 type:complete len:226 (-) Transcript_4871:3603-4280(-)